MATNGVQNWEQYCGIAYNWLVAHGPTMLLSDFKAGVVAVVPEEDVDEIVQYMEDWDYVIITGGGGGDDDDDDDDDEPEYIKALLEGSLNSSSENLV